MKWMIACLLALFLVTPALAGEDPYIGIVGNDADFNPFYWSPKHTNFLFDEAAVLGLPPTTLERFVFLNGPVSKPEFCDPLGTGLGNPNGKVGAGNKGYFQWVIRLPKKPTGEINICLECAVLKPNTDVFGPAAIELCAAETGERLGFGFCTRNFEPFAGADPIVPAALPTLTAIAFPGPFNFFPPFYLTAYKNPGSYKLPFWSLNGQLKSGGDSQTIDGSVNARILLKACMDKCVIVKIPTDGQVNAGPGLDPYVTPCTPASVGQVAGASCVRPLDLPPGLGLDFNTKAGIANPATSFIGIGRQETTLVEGDLIYIRLSVPNTNTVDIFCHEESASLRGVGENPN